jgi:glycosyltransferase involved in cell wall biosynthesis
MYFDICIVTYNRLVYLRRCLESIVASTKIKYRVFVIDDNSNDGTKEYLLECRKRGWVKGLILNKKGMGTAWNFNTVISKTDSEFFVMANDDMYFLNGWDKACIEVISNYKDAGIVSFYDYTRYAIDEGVKKIDDSLLRVPRTGLGASLVNRVLFNKTGGFHLPAGRRMGFLATPFCVKSSKAKYKRNKHYATVPNYAIHMDLPSSPLCERNQMQDYIAHRKKEKRSNE